MKLPLQLPSLALLLSGCILVHVEGGLPEDAWVVDIVAEEITPEGFEHGEPDFLLIGALSSLEGSSELDFRCVESAVPGYLDRLAESLESHVTEDRDGRILERRSPDPWTRSFLYDGEDGRGAVRVRVRELGAGSAMPFRLEISLEEG